MRRLLLVTHAFPPKPVPGALRPGHLAQHLPRFGWNVTVVTNPSYAVSDEPTRGLVRRAVRRAASALLFPDPTANWIPSAIRDGTAALGKEPSHAILSTALPSSAHVAGWALARLSGLPWVADYRDAWSGNPYFRRNSLQQYAHYQLEQRLLRRAVAVSAVSEPLADHLRALLHREDVYVIRNAFDPADWNGIEDIAPEAFDFCYTGSMYDGKRTPELLFSALADLRNEGHPAALAARVHFYGRNDENVYAVASAFGLRDVVIRHGNVPRSHALRAQRRSAVLLLFLSTVAGTSGEFGSKYLEYAYAGRPIMALGPPQSPLAPVIENSGAGWFVSNREAAKHAIVAAYARFKERRFGIEPKLIEMLPTVNELAASFAQLLDRSVVAERRAVTC